MNSRIDIPDSLAREDVDGRAAASLVDDVAWPVIGMVHLKALPGSVGYRGSFDEVFDAAMADTAALTDGGCDAIMIENFGDVPFCKGSVGPHTVAAMTRIVTEIRRATHLALGINVLRNDPVSALAISAACDASFVRVNVHTGAMLTDQGWIEGDANRTLAYRHRLAPSVRIAADVNVKHAVQPAALPFDVHARDAVERGLADALIVTGNRTGEGVDIDELRAVRSAVRVPVLIGSGATPDVVRMLRDECDGVIVGSWLKYDGRLERPVDGLRVRRLVEAARGTDASK